jgi:multiple sugar transport system ATP-binding protein
MATVEYRHVSKIFDGTVPAIEGLSLTIEDGELLVMVGPSGCGKSTALRLIAGLESVTQGDILIDGKVVNQLEPQERDIAMVFQNYALYPHKSVRKNLEFPLRMMKMENKERNHRIERTAKLLNLDTLLNRKPKQLSGGQRQRVAMGRALVRDPKVFLMDEPLSNLDAKLRVEIRAEIADLQKRIGITTLYVTHDQVEAMTLGKRVAVLKDGRLQQVASAQTLYDEPDNVFVATFIGSPQMNVFPSSLRQDKNDRWSFRFGKTDIILDAAARDNRPSRIRQTKENLLIGIRPEAFVQSDTVPPGQRCRVQVHAVEALGHEKIVYFDAPVEMIKGDENTSDNSQNENRDQRTMAARLPARMDIKANQELELGIDTRHIHFFETSGKAIK